MQNFLPPAFQIATGFSFALVLLVGTVGRKAIQTWGGRLTAFSLVAVALGFLLLSNATKSTMGAGAELFIAAGAAFFLAAVLVTAGLLIRARSAD